jgi:hypothetical protein
MSTHSLDFSPILIILTLSSHFMRGFCSDEIINNETGTVLFGDEEGASLALRGYPIHMAIPRS